MNKTFERIKTKTIPFDAKDAAEEILGQHFQRVREGKVPLVLFCAGSSGRILNDFFNKLGIQPVSFCDNNTALVGTQYCDLPVISVDMLKQKHLGSVILIASAGYHRFIKKQLLDEGFHPENILTLDDNENTFDGQLKRERLLMLARNGEPRDMLAEYQAAQDMITSVYDSLEDQKSRSLYISRLALVASGFEYSAYKDFVTRFSEPALKYGYDNKERLNYGGVYFYFNNDIIHLEDEEVFLDGGAYIGDSAQEFIRTCERDGIRYDSIHCFEADPKNYQDLLKFADQARDIHCYSSGLWKSRGQISFVSSAVAESFGARILEPNEDTLGASDSVIDTVAIDDVFQGQRITFIKMDIEGAEYEALQGARHTLQKHRPKLAISVYHKTDDLYRIPALIKEIYPGYRFYLRHLGNYYDDTILFAVAGSE